ncbi:LysR family transcriptional regulator [Microbacterium sp. CFH 31415]|uniref:LysR family transcriptional regulator n=1 Tax=Microbacterium sp. CFH 31415 TaxID=2921732 RepID=UPI001F139370|nr:LysR family transcriptional regulator [Microbacterium sp. CFH 31415]MCH6230896.1 LysR family transcriptional regulator [Microbacterium sp. CFH 31415]
MITDLHTLRSFVAVVECGSVVAAARCRGYSAAAVSRHLGRLQRRLGVALFEPDGRGIRPTQHGLQLAEQARELIAEVRRFDAAVAAVAAAARAGGCSPTSSRVLEG